jgi:hypothetical protein
MRQELGPLALLADEGALESPPAPSAVRVRRLSERRQVVRAECIDLKLRTLGWCIGQIHESHATGQLSVEYAGHLARYLTDFEERCTSRCVAGPGGRGTSTDGADRMTRCQAAERCLNRRRSVALWTS